MSFDVNIEKLVYGGSALAHHQGKPVFVSRALPGERLQVEPVRTVKGILHAEPVQILSASAHRADPPCPYFGYCGGCHYQHIAPPTQTASKAEILRETLYRVGKIQWPAEIAVHSGPAWGYRNQAQFKLAHEPDGKWAIGFFAPASHQVVPVEACHIVSPGLEGVLRSFEEWLRTISAAEAKAWIEGCQEVELMADDSDENVMLTLRGAMNPLNFQSLADALLRLLPPVKTVALQSKEAGQEFQVFGKPFLNYRVGDFTYRVSPGSFFQTSRFLIPELVHCVVNSAMPDAFSAGRGQPSLALDLYAGCGLFALPLTRQFDQVIAVESHPRPAADLAVNARQCQPRRIRAIHQPVFDYLRRFAQAEPSLVVIDPPRAGAGLPALRLLASIAPRRIHYVSCNPPTLARDLTLLLGERYRIDSVHMFDFFPQTYHIESLVTLMR
jgi:23S rRNA (uracil1939-C5)-methyltransferase